MVDAEILSAHSKAARLLGVILTKAGPIRHRALHPSVFHRIAVITAKQKHSDRTAISPRFDDPS